MAADQVDELISHWLATKVRNYAPLDSGHLHYRFECDQLTVYEYKYDTHPLSEFTGDPETCFTVTWGCPHSDERMTVLIRELGSLPEIIAELEAMPPADQTGVQARVGDRITTSFRAAVTTVNEEETSAEDNTA